MLQGEFGKYQIVKMVGMGGMSIVYRAFDQTLNRETALKILNVQRAANPGDVRRFQREVKVAQRLRHPNIIDIFEYGEVDGFAYLAMEYMPGGSLGERYANPVAQTLGDSAEILKTISAALDFAHAQGVLHRDLKLSNILISAHEQLTLSDFGLALLPDASRITESGQTFGTPIYMSPEQVHGARLIDYRADIYSLGVVAYLLATGYYPFLASSSLQILNSHLKANPPLPSRLNPRLPSDMDWVLLKGLAKRPEDRYDSAGALAKAFEEAVAPIASTEIMILTMQPTPIVEASNHFAVPQMAQETDMDPVNWQGDVTPDLRSEVDAVGNSPRERLSGGNRVSRLAAGLGLLVAGILLVVGLGSILPNQQLVSSETLVPEIGIGETVTATPTLTGTPTFTRAFTQTAVPSATMTRTTPPTNTARPSITPTRTLSNGLHTATQRAEQTAAASGTMFMVIQATETDEDNVPTRTRMVRTAAATAGATQAVQPTSAVTAQATMQAPATHVPATQVPATSVPATSVPPTAVPPSPVPPTPVPPTAVPPSPVPPTNVPPTSPPPTNTPIINLPLPTIPLVNTLLPGLIG